MTLGLPDKKVCKRSDADAVEKAFRSVLAYSPGATTTYQFYEEVDAWLGPWSESGYPIGYGKKYNILFNTNAYLNDPKRKASNAWVKNTTINLQLGLLNVILKRVRAGTINLVTEAELREAAFDCHPQAYLQAGLRAVAVQDIESLPVIMLIPYAEFNPTNPNFIATLRQVVDVIEDPGLLAWTTDILRGVWKWPSTKIYEYLGPSYEAAKSELKALYQYFF